MTSIYFFIFEIVHIQTGDLPLYMAALITRVCASSKQKGLTQPDNCHVYPEIGEQIFRMVAKLQFDIAVIIIHVIVICLDSFSLKPNKNFSNFAFDWLAAVLPTNQKLSLKFFVGCHEV